MFYLKLNLKKDILYLIRFFFFKCASKDTMTEWKTIHRVGENICKSYILQVEFSQLNQKTNNLI